MHRSVLPYRVSLREIPPDGLDLELDLSGPFVRQALQGTEADAASARLAATVRLQRVVHDVFVRGRVAGRVTLPCSRCAKEAELPLDASFELTFVPPDKDGRADDAEEVELTADELDVASYDGEAVELEDTLREQILLAFPIAPLCREACKGLCSRCGQDLNEGACACPPEPPADDRWAALKNVKL
jgi:uncharacterized protein